MLAHSFRSIELASLYTREKGVLWLMEDAQPVRKQLSAVQQQDFERELQRAFLRDVLGVEGEAA